MLNLYQLQFFVAVAEAGSYSEAARRLHITQPAVSMSVAALEKALGDRLFHRRGRRMELTPLGQQLLAPARQLLALAAQTELAIQAGHGVVAGRLRLGSATSAGALDLARRLGTFSAVHPQIEITLRTDLPAALLIALRAGELDAVLLGERVRGRSLDHRLLHTDEWVFVVPPTHPWTTQAIPPAPLPAGEPDAPPAAAPLPAVTLDQVRAQPLVLLGTDQPVGLNARRELTALLEERGLAWRELRLALELPTDLAVLAAVEAGAGAGIVGRGVPAGWGTPLRAFSLRGGPLARPLFAVRDRHFTPTPAAAAWWDWNEQ
jgi:DNA-binding transcriptional LysR family regulator